MASSTGTMYREKRAYLTLASARGTLQLPSRPWNLMRFVTGADLQTEPSLWGPHEWLSRPGLTEAEELLLVRVRMPPGKAHQFHRHPAIVDRNNPYVRVLSESVSSVLDSETISVGRDGASDAICFINAGVPAVEFGPVGGGHHGPAEWVSAASLQSYRRTLVDFVRRIPDQITDDKPHLRIA